MWKDVTKGKLFYHLKMVNFEPVPSVAAGVQNCFSIFEPLRNFSID